MTTLYTKPTEIRYNHSTADSLEEITQNAKDMRAEMQAPFFAWVCNQRREVELSAYSLRCLLSECEPFALAAINEAEPIEDGETREWKAMVPAVVLEYASTSLQLKVAEARLELLNEYYFSAADPACGMVLCVSSATTGALWDEWRASREESEDE